jgi:hypothetical protein
MDLTGTTGNNMSKFCKWELFLLVLIGALPEAIKWLTLSFDGSVRGLSIFFCTIILGAAVNIKAYLSNSSSTTVTKNPDSVTIETTGQKPQTPTEPPTAIV